MKNFSLFEQTLKVAGPPKTDLGAVSHISRRLFHEHESFLFRCKAPCFEYACLLIENGLLLKTNRAARIYAGFEELSLMQGVIDRYLRIADVSACVYVFGENDWQPPRHPNLRLISLTPDFRLAQECFLIAASPTMSTGLVAFDEDRFKQTPWEEHNLTAFKTSDARVVQQVASRIEGLINWSLAA